MALKAGRVGVRPDQVDAQGYIIGTTPGPGPGPTPSAGHTYSLTEQEIGTWIDGKTIYEVVVPLTNNKAVLDVDIDTLIYLNGLPGEDSGNIWTINGVSGVNSRYIFFTVATKTITVNGSYSVPYAIIQYTKEEVEDV